MSLIDKGKMALQVFKMKKAIESLKCEYEENGVTVVLNGFMAMSEPKIDVLEVNGVVNKALTEAINKALKKATEMSMKKMQEMGKDLEGAM
jgi:DNA-binding protein YbaB